MTNGGYKIIDLEGLELIRNEVNPNTEVFEKIEKAKKSGKPILINNVKFISDDNPAMYSEIETPLFLQIISVVDAAMGSTSYVFILPNSITGTITNTSITVS